MLSFSASGELMSGCAVQFGISIGKKRVDLTGWTETNNGLDENLLIALTINDDYFDSGLSSVN